MFIGEQLFIFFIQLCTSVFLRFASMSLLIFVVVYV